jgi:hypothetical protein
MPPRFIKGTNHEAMIQRKHIITIIVAGSLLRLLGRHGRYALECALRISVHCIRVARCGVLHYACYSNYTQKNISVQ